MCRWFGKLINRGHSLAKKRTADEAKRQDVIAILQELSKALGQGEGDGARMWGGVEDAKKHGGQDVQELMGKLKDLKIEHPPYIWALLRHHTGMRFVTREYKKPREPEQVQRGARVLLGEEPEDISWAEMNEEGLYPLTHETLEVLVGVQFQYTASERKALLGGQVFIDAGSVDPKDYVQKSKGIWVPGTERIVEENPMLAKPVRSFG